MSTGKRLAPLFLLTTALTLPGIALAQGTGGEPNTGAQGVAGEDDYDSVADTDPVPGDDASPSDDTSADAEQEEPEISVPGGAIVVTGRRIRDVTRSSTQVISVLSTEQIARTGEGDIAGALSRVTGLSVQSGGLVYVRGLGDRYSLALLNGLPLPSPQPLSRVVPLDIFPTNIVASSLVQKTYSANYPGEFGGGVINLTTKAVPDESFLKISAGISGDTETTGHGGYTHYGSDYDWFGFDDGTRDTPPSLKAFFNDGRLLQDIPLNPANADGGLSRAAILKDLIVPDLHVLQKIRNVPANWSGSITAGTAVDVGDGRLGIIASAAISNKWRTRGIHKQFVADANDLAQSNPEEDFTDFVTDNRILVNGLLGLGLEIGEHKFRWTNVYIRDTLKQSQLTLGTDFGDRFEIAEQGTAWYERQLLDSQFVGELKFGDLGIDLRAGYAQTQREAPFETTLRYYRPLEKQSDQDYLYRDDFNQAGFGQFNFSDLKEDLYYGGIDVSYPVLDWLNATVGYAYTDTSRRSSFRSFRVQANRFASDQVGFGYLNPYYILSDAIIDLQFVDPSVSGVNYSVDLNDVNPAAPVVQADLTINAAYGQLRMAPMDGLTFDLGVRYEDAKQVTAPVQVYTTPVTFLTPTTLNNDYLLPAATITYDFDNGMQLRASASKTIARPQFRELIYQPFVDPDTSRLFRGNPELRDSELMNAEARLEYYWGGGNRASIAGFYKDIDRPIEAYSTEQDGRVTISYANAPKAQLYGGEMELQYNYDLYDLGSFFETKRLVAVANYTYAKSKLKVGPDDVTYIFRGDGLDPTRLAANVFTDGAAMTGQSDHLVNLQLGLEDTERVQQFTVLFSYASKRIISRGYNNLPPIVEKPGLRLDFVAREEVNLAKLPLELKFEVRNITGTDHQEYITDGVGRVEVNSYDVGTTISASASIEF